MCLGAGSTTGLTKPFRNAILDKISSRKTRDVSHLLLQSYTKFVENAIRWGQRQWDAPEGRNHETS